MKSKFHLILALACALCFTTSIVGQDIQDVDQPEKPKAAKKAKGEKGKGAKGKGARGKQSPYAKLFGGAELTDAQKNQLTELAAAKKKEVLAIRKNVSELISQENAKSIRIAVRRSTKSGMSQAEAQKSAWDEAGLSAEAQTALTALSNQQTEIEQEIVKQIVATFSDDQKEAMKTEMKRGKKGAGKGGKKKKGKDKKKPEEPEQN